MKFDPISVGLLVNETCEDIDDNQYEIYLNEWKTCQSSCSNKDLEHYLHSSLSTARRFSIYLAVEKNWPKLFHLYEYLTDAFDQADLSFVAIHIKDGEEENVLFLYLLGKNLHLILISIICYLLCLMIFVKNFFLIFTILLHFVLSTSSTLIIYRLFFDLPWTILNVTSVVLFMIILLIDSFLWYACWFNNNHRRDDCPIQRIIENLLTQAFFYLMPKNLTAIIALVITYTNQIIALQCFTVLSLLLITLSFAISFIVYPGKKDRHGERERSTKILPSMNVFLLFFSVFCLHSSLPIMDSNFGTHFPPLSSQCQCLFDQSNDSLFDREIESLVVNSSHPSLRSGIDHCLSMAQIRIRCVSNDI